MTLGTAVSERRFGWSRRARPRSYPPVEAWPRERTNPQTEPGYPQAGPVSRETEHEDSAVNQSETAPVTTSPPQHPSTRPGVRCGTAADLGCAPQPRRRASATTSPPRWPAPSSQQLLVRQGRAVRRPAAASRPHPGDGGGQPEGRGRQDHHRGEHGRRARPARPAGAGHRPRPPGQRLHRPGGRPPPRHPLVLRRAGRRHCRWPTWSSRTPTSPNLFVAPATIDLAGAEIELVSVVARESRLRKAIAAHPLVDGEGEDRYDYVLIDCPPSLGLLTLNALVAGAEMLIPIQAEYYALEGLGQLLETVEMVQHAPQPGPRGQHDPDHDVRLPHQPGGRRRRRGARALRRPGAQDRDPALGAGLRGAELRPERDDLRPRIARGAQLSRSRA